MTERTLPAHTSQSASLTASGLTLSLPASLCSRQGKCLPNFFAPLPPPQAAVARSPQAAVARSPLKGSHGCGANHPSCHCEGGFLKKIRPWQSFGSCIPCRYFPEIATASSKPRNDIVRTAVPILSLRGGRSPTWQSVSLGSPTIGELLSGAKLRGVKVSYMQSVSLA